MTQKKVDGLFILLLMLTFLMSMALVHDHIKHGSWLNDHLMDRNAPIERALKRINQCAHGTDTSRQRALLYTLQAWVDFAHQHRLIYWISHQALFNYIQSYTLGPNDFHIDVSIMFDDVTRLILLIEFMKSSIYELQVNLQWQSSSRTNRSTFLHRIKFINHEQNVSINIWPNRLTDDNRKALMIRRQSNTSLVVPSNWIFPLDFCIIAGVDVWCPAYPKELLTFVYSFRKENRSCPHETLALCVQ